MGSLAATGGAGGKSERVTSLPVSAIWEFVLWGEAGSCEGSCFMCAC